MRGASVLHSEPLLPPSDFLDDCAPSYRALHSWLCERVDDEMLREMADADYGWNHDKHLAALQRLRDYVEMDAPMPWEPREVLELVRWSEPDRPDDPDAVGSGDSAQPEHDRRRRGHLKRSFACASLLVAGSVHENWTHIFSENESLIQLCRSAIALEPEAVRHTASLIAWRMLEPFYQEAEMGFFGVALLILELELFPGGLSVAQIEALCRWVMGAELLGRISRRHHLESSRWLLGIDRSSCQAAWERAARQCLVEPPAGLPESVAECVRDIGQRLAGPGTGRRE